MATETDFLYLLFFAVSQESFSVSLFPINYYLRAGINAALQKLLKDLEVQEVVYASYCDEAYHRFIKAYQEQTSYDLLISDLSFSQDHKEERIRSGEELSIIRFRSQGL